MCMKRFLITLVARVPFFSSSAQERTAGGGAVDVQVSWTGLKNLVDAANVKATAAQTVTEAIKTCGNKGMLYGPGSSQPVDSDGCVAVNSTPKNAVMAFHLTACPAGWSEYVPARGRFIRGIDVTGVNDPSGTRPLGSLQTDTLQNVTGHFSGNNMTPDGPFGRASGEDATWGKSGGGRRWWLDFDLSRAARTSNETRPKNVALLYCYAN